MQFLGALSLLFSVVGMLCRIFDLLEVSGILFISSLSFMTLSLLSLVREIWISGGALRIVLKALEKDIQEIKFHEKHEKSLK